MATIGASQVDVKEEPKGNGIGVMTYESVDDIIPNRWELFLVRWPKSACSLFFGISVLMTFASIRLLAGEKLVITTDGVWDVRADIIVRRADAFGQSFRDSGKKLMCGRNPCEVDEAPRPYATRSQALDKMAIIYEATGDDENMMSEKNLGLMKEFEEKLGKMQMYQTACQLVKKKSYKRVGSTWVEENTTDTQCGASTSLVNDVFVDGASHETLMTNKCYSNMPVCTTGGAFCVQAASTAPPCLKCGTGGVPFGSPPCVTTMQASLSTKSSGFAPMCNGLAAAANGSITKTGAHFTSQRSQLLPRQFACNGQVAGKSKYARSFMAFGAPLKGYTTFAGDSKEEQEKEFNKFFVNDLWNDIVTLKADIEKKSDGGLRIYALCASAMGSMMNSILINDALLALGSLVFVLFWIWTSTGSFFLAICGVYECFISLFLAMLTFAPISKYIGFLNVMMLFVILGIGADDIFVFVDAFKQSAYEAHLGGDIEKRFAWSYRRSTKAMFVTTASTCISFLSAGFSDIPTVSAFGFFAAFTVAWDFIMVITFFASATVMYHQYFEGKKGGHMCMDYKCCCLRLLTPELEKRSKGWRAYTPLIITVSILSCLGIMICAIGSAGNIPFVPMLGAIILSAAAICLQAVANMPEKTATPRMLEAFFSNTFHSFIDSHKKKILIVWAVVILACVIVVGVVFRPAEDAPAFLSKDHDLMRWIDLSSEFSVSTSGPSIIHTVFGIDKTEPIDRAGVDFQAPAAEHLGTVAYSPAAAASAATPAGQNSILKLCDALRASSLVVKDPSCTTRFHAGANLDFSLPSLGSDVGHCETGVYCYMYNVRDYLTAHCKACPRVNGKLAVGSKGCNPSANFTACKDSAGAVLAPTFPAPDLHKVLQSTGFKSYVARLPELRFKAGHGHENKLFDTYSGFKYNPGGWMSYVGANFSMSKRSSYKEKVDFYDRTKAFVEANTDASLQAFATCWRFNWMVTEAALLRNTFQAVGIAVIFAWFMLVFATWNWILGTLGFLAVCTICIVACAFMAAMGWDLGVIESIAIITVVGVSVDYSVHLIHAYSESEAATAAERVRSALSTMGISLIGGVATTFGAASFLWFTEIQFFTKFGQFLATTVIVSIVVALTLLMPACLLVGPTGSTGQLPWVRCPVKKFAGP